MVTKNYTIIDETGIHARPATILVNAVTPYDSEVTLEYKGKQANLKSIMGIMSLGIPKGAKINVAANGDDEQEVLSKIDEVMAKEGLAE